MTKKQDRKRPGILTGKTQGALERLIDKPVEQLPPLTSSFHFLIEEGYKGYNIVSYNKIYYGLPQALGATDLTIKKDREKPGILTAKDQKELKVLVDKATTENTILLHAPTLIEEGYKGYNIIAYGGKYYALAQAE